MLTKKKYRIAAGKSGLAVTTGMIEDYIADMQEKGRVQGTLDGYRRDLILLYDFLPPDKYIRSHSLAKWRESLLEQGYSPRTVNARLSAANSFLGFYGRRDLQISRQLQTSDYTQPELTRNEYIRLLQTARTLEKERLYLLIKLFGTTGIAVRDLVQVTAEAVQAGVICAGSRSKPQHIRLPACLQHELMEFADRNGRTTGMLFVTRTGKPLSRTNVADAIRHLCHDAQVSEDKGNPRCLRLMYQRTQDGIRQNMSALIEQAYDRLLETEQVTVGWVKE